MPADETSPRTFPPDAGGSAPPGIEAQASSRPSVDPIAPVPDDKTVISKRPPLAAGAVPFAASLQVMGTTLVGKTLEHYELNEFVGGGGMGAVFRATDTRLGRTVAVKVLSRDHSDEETIRRFRNEAQSAARLDHPNIARVYYVGEDQGLNFIVFEFIEGTNLRDEVDRQGPLDLERALHYTLQVAEALAHSSSREVVHRDIKPSNVLVTATGQVKLVDMGLARLHQVESSDDDLTASGVTLGTFDYISPEQARDPRVADVRSDIYSLGCTLFYMLTGQPPFPDGTALQKLIRHNSDEPPDVRVFRPELSPRVAALLARMLAKRPSQRQQSAAELIADLVGLGQQLGLTTVAEYGPLVVVSSSRSSDYWSRAWQILGAVGLLVAALLITDAIATPRQAGGEVALRPRFKKSAESGLEADVASPEKNVESNARAADPATKSLRQSSSDETQVVGSNGRLTTHQTVDSTETLPSASRSDAANSHAPHDRAGPTRNGDVADAGNASSLARLQRRIVVLGNSLSPPEPLTEFVTTLEDACQRAAESGSSDIELRFNGHLVSEPLEIGSARLTIRAAPGYQPVVVFRPLTTAIDRHMIQLAAGGSAHLALEGVELRMELDDELLADGWSLLAISTGQSVDLSQCVLTVKDGDLEHPSIHDQVSMIAVHRRRPSETMTMSESQLAMGQPARIDLERTIARGEASLVSLTDETPLTIRWNQGLLVTSQHLIETGGSAAEPQHYEQIVLDLDNVTACCRQGLYYLRRGPGKAFQFQVNAYADRCIFVTNPGASLFEMVGLSALPESHELQSTGDENRFSPADMPFLLIRATAGSEPQAFKLGRNWSTETRSQAGVPWLHPLPIDRAAHDAAKRDYLIDAELLTTATGFDPMLLPDPASTAP